MFWGKFGGSVARHRSLSVAGTILVCVLGTILVLWCGRRSLGSVQRRSLVSGVDLSKQACGSMAATLTSNPLLGDWTESNEFGLPPFSKITAADFEPAFEFAMKEHLDDLRKIVEENDG